MILSNRFKLFLLIGCILVHFNSIILLPEVKPDSLSEIQQVFFMADKNQLFFICQDISILGYIDIYIGQVSRLYAFSPKEKIIRFDRQALVIQFLSEQNKIYFFDIKTEEKKFKTDRYKIENPMKSFAYFQKYEQLYSLQDWALVFYNENNEKGKTLFNVGQNQTMIGLVPFSNTEDVVLVYSRVRYSIQAPAIHPYDQKDVREIIIKYLCLKQYQGGQLLEQSCLNTNYIDVSKIYRNDIYIQIQTPSQNYVLKGFKNNPVKINGKPVQSFNKDVVLDNMKTYRLFSSAYYTYLVVQAPSCSSNQFKLSERQDKWVLFKESSAFRLLQKQKNLKPYRSWIHKYDDKKYYFVYQNTGNQLFLYDLSSQNPYLLGSTAYPRWKFKGLHTKGLDSNSKLEYEL